jgi:DNA-binding PucR family transcriptional regulator
MLTLEAFYYHNGDINQTAEQLYIHPNTLRKRLKKLETILNVDFNQLEDMLKIFVALKIMKILK